MSKLQGAVYDRPGAHRAPLQHQPQPLSEDAEIYQALVVGTRDYVSKNGFKKVVVGLSGGIDSALTATIAADALGAGFKGFSYCGTLAEAV